MTHNIQTNILNYLKKWSLFAIEYYVTRLLIINGIKKKKK
jgi:hypothetical protein